MLIFTKMNKDMKRVLEIPEGINLSIDENKFTAKGNGKELSKVFDIGKIKFEVENNKVTLWVAGGTKKEAKMMGTISAHLKNMIKGIEDDFVYELEICNIHFPMNVKIENNKALIKSFLGEKTIREAKILQNVKVDISGSKITVTSHNIEAAGQTAANLEKATKLTGRDRRIFQDGIFITKKPYRVI